MSFLEIIQANDIQKIREEIAKGGLDENLLLGALTLAAEKGYLEIIQILLKAGVNPNRETYSGTPLGLAALNGHLSIVKTLIEAGANVNYQHQLEENKTPLINAVQERHFEIVKLLVEKGANVNTIVECQFALGVAADSGYEEIFDYLALLTELKLRKEAEEWLPEGIRQRQREESADPCTNELCWAAFDNDNVRYSEVIEILQKAGATKG